ncbi:ribonuclease domain-containing protein [Corynebacterium alimapuense]|uniref:Ribonuclease n=1 Tax=Corynebacterium alimapuense TaxID=1576874 RepID=A0A3M8KAK6_9CORY|nr:ribonuclease domain-containing protein [Corynebacterium alimapuense]RNE49574.1 ribonuclease [Corynebacterium alimapuense]
MKKNSTIAVVGSIAVILAASFFGLDLTSENTSVDEASSSAELAGQESATSVDGYEVCPVATLPVQADLVVDDILAGGPYTYPEKDGEHFGNYEDVLPDESSSYYRSYTVETPGLDHRGLQRIVVGGPEDDPETWFYSDDHYDSFCLIPDAEE